MTKETVMIENKTGIRASLASVFANTAVKFKSRIQIRAKCKTINAKSILMIMHLNLTKGTKITIVADGPDEEKAVKTLKELIESKFGEE